MSNQDSEHQNLESENSTQESHSSSRQQDNINRQTHNTPQNAQNSVSQIDSSSRPTNQSTRHSNQSSRPESSERRSSTSRTHLENIRSHPRHSVSHSDHGTQHRETTTSYSDHSRRPQGNDIPPDSSSFGVRFITPDSQVPVFPERPVPLFSEQPIPFVGPIVGQHLLPLLPDITVASFQEWPESDSSLSEFTNSTDEEPSGLAFTLPLLDNGVQGFNGNTSNTLESDKAEHPLAFTLVNLSLWVVMILFVVLPMGLVSALVSVPVSIVLVLYPHTDLVLLSDLLEMAQLLPAICVKQMLLNTDFLIFMDLDLQLLG